MIICVVSVGEKYNTLSKNEIKKFIDNGDDVYILTDNPEAFEYGNTFKYEKKIFSFFEKLLFTGKIVENKKENVFYIDADRLDEINPKNIQKFKDKQNFVFFDYWQKQIKKDKWVKWVKINDFENNYFEPLFLYCKKNNVSFNNLYCFWEGFFVFPYNHMINDIIYELEQIKPIFEYMSIIGEIADNIYLGKLGFCEGLALSYIIEKNKLKFEKYEIKYINETKFL